MKKLRSEYKIDKVSIVADSALMNNVNLKDLEENNFTYIISARVRNLNKELTDEMLKEADYVKSESDIKYKVIKLEGKSLILVHSAARSRKDAYDRAKSIEKAMKHVGSSAKGKLSGSLKKPYFTLSKDCQIVLDEKKILEASQFDGYFGFYTNLDMKPEEVISQYKGLWQVEQTFRITKHNIKIRPVYHWNQHRIKAHFAICFLALSIMRFTEVLLRRADNHTSLEELHNMLEQVQLINIISKGEKYAIRTDMNKELLQIYRILGINKPETFTPIP
jgi:transposase